MNIEKLITFERPFASHVNVHLKHGFYKYEDGQMKHNAYTYSARKLVTGFINCKLFRFGHIGVIAVDAKPSNHKPGYELIPWSNIACIQRPD